MPRIVINRSISFDPQIFERMEERRGRLMMQRSEYVTRCIIRDMAAGGDMTISEVSPDLVPNPTARQRTKKKGK